MVTLKELRKAAAGDLSSIGNDSPLADADYLLIHLLGFSRRDLILGDRTLDNTQKSMFDEALKRLKSGEPVQYIAGKCEFMSLWFEVNRHTLIPRSDTEILVEAVADRCKGLQNLNILDIGTGSGCIAISLAHFLPKSFVTAIDISKDALTVAEKNAKSVGVSGRCTFLKWDIMQGFPTLKNPLEVIVSNPPYIPDADIDSLDKKVKSFEPLSALSGGNDGLDFYRRIVDTANLAKGGILAFEVGINQSQAVCDIMSDRFCDIQIKKDLGGIYRVIIGTLKS